MADIGDLLRQKAGLRALLPPNQNNQQLLSEDKVKLPPNQNSYELTDSTTTDIDNITLFSTSNRDIKIPLSKANSVIKALTGGFGADYLLNIDPNNQDIITYIKKIYQSPENYGRIPLDIALRELLKATVKNKSLMKSINTVQNFVKDPLNSLLNLAGSIGSKSANEPLPDNWKKEIPSNTNKSEFVDKYLGYSRISDDSLVEEVHKVAQRFKPGYENAPIKDLSFNEDGEEVWITTRKRLVDFEMADNGLWGVRMGKYNAGESSLPDFPDAFNSGWWPILSVNFTKSNIKSKNIQLPYLNLKIPLSGERPQGLKMTVLDNARRDIRYWLEGYTKKCFDITNNLVAPYKNVCFDIVVYRYDCTYSVLYRKELLCVISDPVNIFTGEQGHNADELDIEFSIVGEIPNEYSKSNYNNYGSNDRLNRTLDEVVVVEDRVNKGNSENPEYFVGSGVQPPYLDDPTRSWGT